MKARRSATYHEIPDVCEMDPWKDDRCRDFVALNTIQRLRAYHLAPDLPMPPVDPVNAVRAKNLFFLPRPTPDCRPCMGEVLSSVPGASPPSRLSSSFTAAMVSETKKEEEAEKGGDWKGEEGKEDDPQGMQDIIRTPPSHRHVSSPALPPTPQTPSRVSTLSSASFPFSSPECVFNTARQVFFGRHAFSSSLSPPSLASSSSLASTPLSRPTCNGLPDGPPWPSPDHTVSAVDAMRPCGVVTCPTTSPAPPSSILPARPSHETGEDGTPSFPLLLSSQREPQDGFAHDAHWGRTTRSHSPSFMASPVVLLPWEPLDSVASSPSSYPLVDPLGDAPAETNQIRCHLTAVSTTAPSALHKEDAEAIDLSPIIGVPEDGGGVAQETKEEEATISSLRCVTPPVTLSADAVEGETKGSEAGSPFSCVAALEQDAKEEIHDDEKGIVEVTLPTTGEAKRSETERETRFSPPSHSSFPPSWSTLESLALPEAHTSTATTIPDEEADPLSVRPSAELSDMRDPTATPAARLSLPSSIHVAPTCACAVVDALIAHYQSLLARGVVLDRYNHKELAFAWWVIGRNMDMRALDHPGTARREALLITIRNFYYSQLSSKRRPSTGMTSGERGGGASTVEDWASGVGDDERSASSRHSGGASPMPSGMPAGSDASATGRNDRKGGKKREPETIGSSSSPLGLRVEEKGSGVVSEMTPAKETSSTSPATAHRLSPRVSSAHRRTSEGDVRHDSRTGEERGEKKSATTEEDGTRWGKGREGRRRGREEAEKEEEEEKKEEENEERPSSRRDAIVALVEGQEIPPEIDDREAKKSRVEWEKGERKGKSKGKAVPFNEEEDSVVRLALLPTPSPSSRISPPRRAPTSREEKRRAMEEVWVRSSSRANRHARSPERIEVFEALMQAVRSEEERLRLPTSAVFLTPPLPPSKEGRPAVGGASSLRGRGEGTMVPAVPSQQEKAVGEEEGRRSRHKGMPAKREEKNDEGLWEAVGRRRRGRGDGQEERTTSLPPKQAEASTPLPSSVEENVHDHRVKKETEKEIGNPDTRHASSSSSSSCGVLPKSRKKQRESSGDVDHDVHGGRVTLPEAPPLTPPTDLQEEPTVHEEDDKVRRKKRRVDTRASVRGDEGRAAEEMSSEKKTAAEEGVAPLSSSSPLTSATVRKRHVGEHRTSVPSSSSFSSSATSSSVNPTGVTARGEEDGTEEDGKKGRKKSHTASTWPLRAGNGASLPLAALFSVEHPSTTTAATAVHASAPSCSSPPALSFPVLSLSTLHTGIQERLRFRLYGGGGGVPLAPPPPPAVAVPDASLSASCGCPSTSVLTDSFSLPFLPSPSPQEYLHHGGYPSHLLSSYRFLLLSCHHLTSVDPADRMWSSSFASSSTAVSAASPFPKEADEKKERKGEEWQTGIPDNDAACGGPTTTGKPHQTVGKEPHVVPLPSPIPPYYRAHIPALAAVDLSKEKHGGIDPVLMTSSFYRHNHREWATYMCRTLSEYYEQQKAKKREEEENAKALSLLSRGIEHVEDGHKEERASSHAIHSPFSVPILEKIASPADTNDEEKPYGTAKEGNRNEKENDIDGGTEDRCIPSSNAFSPCVQESGSERSRSHTVHSTTKNVDENPSHLPPRVDAIVPSDTLTSMTTLPSDIHTLTYAQQCLLVWEADCLLDNAVSGGRKERRKEEWEWWSKQCQNSGSYASLEPRRVFPVPKEAACIDYWSEYR